MSMHRQRLKNRATIPMLKTRVEPCTLGDLAIRGGYIKHLKHPGRGHSSSHANVSDTWNFVKQWDVNGLISENLNQNHQILPK